MSTADVLKRKRDAPKSNGRQSHLWQGAPAMRKNSRNFSGLTFAVTDFLFVCAGGLIAYALRFSPTLSTHFRYLERPASAAGNFLSEHLGFLLLYVTLLLLAAHWQNLYRQYSGRYPQPESERVLRAIAVATLVLIAFIYLSGIKTVSRLFVGFTAVFSTLLLVSWRVCRSQLRRKQFAKGN